MTGRRRLATFALVPALIGVVSAATPVQAAPVGVTLRSFTASATTVDLTRGAGSVVFRISLLKPDTGRPDLFLESFVPAPGSPSGVGPPDVFGHPLVPVPVTKLVSGTAQDGVWEVDWPLVGGLNGRLVFGLSAGSQGGFGTWSSSDLTALGFPSSVTARTTAAPPAPTNLKGKTVTKVIPDLVGIPRVYVYSIITYSFPAAVAARQAELVSYTKSCGSPPPWTRYEADTPSIAFNNRTIGVCTVKLRAVNGFGYSPTVSVSFI